MPRVIGEEVCGEIGVAEHAILVEGVAEGNRAPVVPAVVYVRHGRVRLAVERQPERRPLEAATGTVVGSSKRVKGADQPDIPVRVVEYQRDGLLAMLHVGWGGLVELLEQRRDQFIEQEIAHLLGECDLPTRRWIVICRGQIGPC